MSILKNSWMQSSVSCGLAAAACVFTATPAAAQDAPPPPEQDTESGTGVSLVSGGYSTSATDLQIGQGDFPQALSLTRQYSSSMRPTHANTDGLQGWVWTTNLTMNIVPGILGGGDYPPDEPPPDTPGRYPWRYSITNGTGTVASFVEMDPITDPIIGPNYAGPFGSWGEKQPGNLSRVGDDLIYTGLDGTKHIFEGGTRQTFRDNELTFRTRMEAPDGTTLTFHGDLGSKAIFSNRGLAIVFEMEPDGKTWSKSCAVNLALHYLTPLSNCPSGVPSVTYQHASVSGYYSLVKATDQLGYQTSYGYSGDAQLTCIKLHGQSSCQVSNTYSNCKPIPNEPTDYMMNSNQQVLMQTFIDGQSITYDFAPERFCPLKPPGSGQYSAPISSDVTMTFSDGSTKTVTSDYEGFPRKIVDGLGRESVFTPGIQNFANRNTKIVSAHAPEGNRWDFEYYYDRVSRTTAYPKSGTGSLVSRTVFGTCGQPVATIDPRGNQTDIVYDANHCGILKKTLPADSAGIRPETRYNWAQRYAWIKNASGSFTQASSPVWVMVSEEMCRTSAADASGNCAAGAGDKVVTSYEYQQGSASKGSNVFRIGQAVTADGQTLRTCYRLDEYGRQISETQPKAGLTSCQS